MSIKIFLNDAITLSCVSTLSPDVSTLTPSVALAVSSPLIQRSRTRRARRASCALNAITHIPAFQLVMNGHGVTYSLVPDTPHPLENGVPFALRPPCQCVYLCIGSFQWQYRYPHSKSADSSRVSSYPRCLESSGA